jgi:hypothetical protein
MAKKRRLIKDLTRVGQRVRSQRRHIGSSLWRRKSHKIWSLIVRFLAGWKCEICGVSAKEKVLNSHHVLFKERYQHLAFTLENGLCTCQNCHKIDKYSCHLNPLWFVTWMKINQPRKYIWALNHVMDETTYITDFKAEHDRLYAIAVSYGLLPVKKINKELNEQETK